jgi:hypothetical protein
MPKFSLENVVRIYDDATGDYLEIGPDMDALDLIEIRAYAVNDLGNPTVIIQRITIHPDSLDLVIQALEKFKKV